ncbi:hypothetical protein [uncultured Boseongicola sp.]
MRGISPDVVWKDKTSFRAVLEIFALSELQKIATWSEN